MTRDELNSMLVAVVRTARKQQGITQQALASQLKMGVGSAISIYEISYRLMPVNVMVKFLAGLNIKLVLNGTAYTIKKRSDLDAIVSDLTIADRKRKDMTYAEYAKLIGMSITVVSFAEKRKSKYSLTYFAKVITASNSTLEFIVE